MVVDECLRVYVDQSRLDLGLEDGVYQVLLLSDVSKPQTVLLIFVGHLRGVFYFQKLPFNLKVGLFHRFEVTVRE